jgi:Flp pilus assembly protein TadG
MIEAAFIMPLAFFLLFAGIETLTLLAAWTTLDAAVHEAARAGVTGSPPSGTTLDAYVLATARAHVAFVNPSNVTLTTKVFPSFAAMQANPSGGTAGLGVGSDIVLYTVNVNWTFLGGYGQKIFGVPNIPLSASLAVRNEPF